MRKYPKPFEVYTFREICEDLILRDSPHLMFYDTEGERDVIQTSHMTEEDMLSVEGFADSKWKYIRETDEWIPIFMYAGDVDIFTFVMKTEEPYGDETYSLKGFPRC